MANYTTELDQAKINKAGEDLIDNAKKMYDSLGKVRDLIDGSKSYFDSEAGDEVRKKFKISADKFDEFKSYLNTYGEYLKTFSGNVVKFEQAVKDATQKIPTM